MASYDEIFEFVKESILDLKDIDEEDITPASTIEGLELESLDFIEIQVGLQKHFKIAVTPEMFDSDQIVTLGDFCKEVEQLSLDAIPA